MLTYRNTPPQGHTYSPAQRMFGRRTRTSLPTASGLLSPHMVDSEVVHQELLQRRARAKMQYDKHATTEHAPLRVGAYAYVKPPPHLRGKPWFYGIITDTPAPRSYAVQTPTGTVRRNRVQLRPAASPRLDVPTSVKACTYPLPMRMPPRPSLVVADGAGPEPRPTGNKDIRPSAQQLPKPIVRRMPDVKPQQEPIMTRSGRVVKRPSRLDL